MDANTKLNKVETQIPKGVQAPCKPESSLALHEKEERNAWEPKRTQIPLR